MLFKLFRAGLAALVLSSSAQATVIFSSDLNGTVVDGDTLTDISWFTNGVEDLGALSVACPVGSSTADCDLITRPNGRNKFAVDRNIHNESDWSVLFAVNTLSEAMMLDSLFLDAYIFANSGNYQCNNCARDLDFVITLFDMSDNVLGTSSALNVFNSNGRWTRGKEVELDLSGIRLASNSMYSLFVTATGVGPGNNAGFDNPTLTGTVPTPSMLGLFLVGLLGMFGRKLTK